VHNFRENVLSSIIWQELEDERKPWWNKKASKKEKLALDDLTESQRKKLVAGVLHQINDEVHISANNCCYCVLELHISMITKYHVFCIAH